MSTSHTKVLEKYKNSIAIGSKSLPPGDPLNDQTILFDSSTNMWKYGIPAAPAGLVDLTTNQNVGGAKTFTDIVKSNNGMIASKVGINTPISGPNLDILQNQIMVQPTFLSGIKIRDPTNTNSCVFGWGPAEFSIYNGTQLITNIAQGKFTSLTNPVADRDACTKIYADTVPAKNMSGLIPPLFSTDTSVNTKTGFFATASSSLSSTTNPDTAFDQKFGTAWSTNNITTNSWIRIQCPSPVRIWQIALKGNPTNTERIFDWRLEGSNDGVTFTTLTSGNPNFLGDTLQNFPISDTNTYSYFRLFINQSESPRATLSYFQVFPVLT